MPSAKKRFPGSNFLFYLYIASMMVPGQVTLVPLFMVMNSFGLQDTYRFDHPRLPAPSVCS